MRTSTILTATFLAILFLASCAKTAPSANSSDSLSIAYINGDSVLMHFKAFREASDKLDARQKELESQLQAKGAALENEIKGYQFQAQSGSLTPKEMQAREKYLAGRQEALLAERDRLAQEMLKESGVINDQLKRHLRDKLEKIKARDGYDFILSKSEGGPILLADAKYDITAEILKLLNEEPLSIAPDTSGR